MTKDFANSLVFRVPRAPEPRIAGWTCETGGNEVDGIQTPRFGCMDGVSALVNPDKHEGQFGTVSDWATSVMLDSELKPSGRKTFVIFALALQTRRATQALFSSYSALTTSTSERRALTILDSCIVMLNAIHAASPSFKPIVKSWYCLSRQSLS